MLKYTPHFYAFIILAKLDNNWTVGLTFTELSKNGNPLDGYKHKKWKRIEHKIQDVRV